MNSYEMAKLMLDRGADPNWVIFNHAPLHFAVSCAKPNLQFYHLLLERGANINLKVSDKTQGLLLLLLQSGLTSEKMPVFQLLLDKGDTVSDRASLLNALVKYVSPPSIENLTSHKNQITIQQARI